MIVIPDLDTVVAFLEYGSTTPSLPLIQLCKLRESLIHGQDLFSLIGAVALRQDFLQGDAHATLGCRALTSVVQQHAANQ